MRLLQVDETVERPPVSEKCLGRERGADVSEHGEPLRGRDGQRRVRGAERGAVDQGESVLGVECDGGQPERGEHFGAGAELPRVPHRALTDQCRGHVAERHQIPARTDRATLRNHWQNVVGEQVGERQDDGRVDRGIPPAQAVGSDEERRPHHLRRCRWSRPVQVVADEVVLQLGRLLRRDLPHHAVPETGGDPVDRHAGLDEAELHQP